MLYKHHLAAQIPLPFGCCDNRQNEITSIATLDAANSTNIKGRMPCAIEPSRGEKRTTNGDLDLLQSAHLDLGSSDDKTHNFYELCAFAQAGLAVSPPVQGCHGPHKLHDDSAAGSLGLPIQDAECIAAPAAASAASSAVGCLTSASPGFAPRLRTAGCNAIVRDAAGALGAAIGLLPIGAGGMYTIGARGVAIGLLPIGAGRVNCFGTGGLSCCGDSLGACPAAGMEDKRPSAATATVKRTL
jgi:hypothetical protein